MATAPVRTTLVVVFGGQSAEHDVSCVTATHVLRAADPSRYETVAVGIARDGSWWLPRLAQLPVGGIDPAALPGHLVAEGTPTGPEMLFAARDRGSFVVFPVVHGPLGEDGTLQGLLEMTGVPFVGSGVLACSLAMDKAMAKTVFARVGLPQVRHHVLREDQVSTGSIDAVVADLGWPIFVKPANMGSSVGVSRAATRGELDAAIELAARYDQWILFEEAVVGRELEVAILGNREPRASVVGEIVPGHDFYDYDDKYLSASADLVIPAALTEEQSDEMRRLAITAYQALRCEGMARVDFFFEPDGRGFLLNEINTIPGFTPISMYPKMWAASGVDYPSLVDELVRLAFERWSRQKRHTAR